MPSPLDAPLTLPQSLLLVRIAASPIQVDGPLDAKTHRVGLVRRGCIRMENHAWHITPEGLRQLDLGWTALGAAFVATGRGQVTANRLILTCPRGDGLTRWVRVDRTSTEVTFSEQVHGGPWRALGSMRRGARLPEYARVLVRAGVLDAEGWLRTRSPRPTDPTSTPMST